MIERCFGRLQKTMMIEKECPRSLSGIISLDKNWQECVGHQGYQESKETSPNVAKAKWEAMQIKK